MVRNDSHTRVIDARQVAAALCSTGSSDPDVLFARKEELLADTRKMRAVAAVTIAAGIVMSLTVVGAVLGVPVILRGLAIRRGLAESVQTVESAYCKYLMESVEQRKKAPVSEVRVS